MLEKQVKSNIIFTGDVMINFFRRFMQGRYGLDKLNQYLLAAGFICCILSFLLGWLYVLNVLFTLLSYVFLFWAIARCFSRKTYKRYRENRKFLQFLEKLKDKDHRYFDCPRCHQQVRVPKNKGKISITCPKCREKFIKKT